MTLADGVPRSEALRASLAGAVRAAIGAFAVPDTIHWAPALPKTRSGGWVAAATAGPGLGLPLVLRLAAWAGRALLVQSASRPRQHLGTSPGPASAPSRRLSPPVPRRPGAGKIMRRVLRKIAAREEEQLGDVSTLADPGVVAQLVALRGV